MASAIVVGAVTIWQVAMAAAGLHWYEGLLKPAISPSPWLAAAVCVALALTLGWAFFRVLCRPDYLPDRPGAIRLFLIALALDAMWSWMFFAGRHPTVALAAAAALAALSPFVVWRFAMVDRRAGLLLIPWSTATVAASLIDVSIALRNG